MPRTLLGIGIPLARETVARAAAGHVELVGTFGTPEAILERLDDTIDLVIADISVLRAIGRRHRRRGTGAARSRPVVILAIAEDELRDALGLLNLCHGLLYWQHDLAKLGRLIVITLEGYCSVPSARLPDLISDRVRIGLIDRLLDLERRTLQLLGQALTNRAIARELGVPEPVAKSLVRSVLTKLRLKNRTEAAVFAVRWFGSDSTVPAPGKSTAAPNSAPALNA